MRIAVMLVPFALLACGGGGGGGGPTEAPINITSSGFLNNAGASASSITIPSGGRVHFFNKDSANHQVASSDCAELDTPLLQPAQDSLRPTMTGPRTCNYHDAINASLTGIVTVNAPATGGGGGGGGSGY